MTRLCSLGLALIVIAALGSAGVGATPLPLPAPGAAVPCPRPLWTRRGAVAGPGYSPFIRIAGSGVVYDGVPLEGVSVRLGPDGQILLRGPMLKAGELTETVVSVRSPLMRAPPTADQPSPKGVRNEANSPL